MTKYFKVSKRDAKETVQDFADTISERWDIYVSDYGISKSEQDYYALRQRLWNGGKKRGQRERKMFYNARCVNKGL